VRIAPDQKGAVASGRLRLRFGEVAGEPVQQRTPLPDGRLDGRKAGRIVIADAFG